MNIAGTLVRAARRFGDRPAVSRGADKIFTYSELAGRAAGLAGWLRNEVALKPGDRVAVVMANRPEYLEILNGIWMAGLVAVPINARLHAREIAYILDSAEAAICFVGPDTAAAVAPLHGEISSLRLVVSVVDHDYDMALASDPLDLAERASTDTAWLFYTSGTTGRPKGAMLTHRNLWSMAIAHWADIDSMGPNDTMIHAAPLSHGCGLWSIAAVGRGANNVLLETPSYDPDEVLRLIQRWRNVSMYHAPTMLKRLVSSPNIRDFETSNLRTLIYGGSHMYVADLQRALDVFGPKLVQIYGQGESPNTISMLGKSEHVDRGHPDWLAILASAGTARSGVEVRIVDAEGRPIATGQLGEVAVRGDVVMAGYWRDPIASEQALRGGWLYTGDVGVMNEAGVLTLKDRSRDMIISGGANIYPREIEEVLLRHPTVLECSVIGRPHPEWGEEVVAVVVARPGQRVDSLTLDRLCLESIARYKRPRAYILRDSLPKNNYGKILKTVLRSEIVGG